MDAITILGFVITIWQLLRTKKAADAARFAAESAKDQLSRLDTLSMLSTALALMDEIKRLHRVNAWEIVPDRYSELSRLLVQIEKLSPDLGDEDKSILVGAVSQFRTMEDQVERARANQATGKLQIPRLNKIVSERLDELNRIMVVVKQRGVLS